MKVKVETSARHLHVSKDVLETLFGKGYELTVKKNLSQPGQFACAEKVTVVGTRGEKAMSILGPCRAATQIEISATDARALGFDSFIRESGHIEGTPGCTLKGPKGEVELKEGVIVAKRHLHSTPEDAEKMGLTNGQIVKLALNTEGRKTVFDDVVVRVSSSYATAVHLDTDEANAANCPFVAEGEIIA